MVVASLPVPGPSFLRPLAVRVRGGPGAATAHTLTLGMSRPSTTDDGWWLGHLWAADGEHIADAALLTPADGQPEPPAALGPPFAGALAGLVAEEGGRQQVRLKLYPAADPTRPWERPLALQVAIRWDPVRAATMRPNELAAAVLDTFGRALRSLAASA